MDDLLEFLVRAAAIADALERNRKALEELKRKVKEEQKW